MELEVEEEVEVSMEVEVEEEVELEVELEVGVDMGVAVWVDLAVADGSVHSIPGLHLQRLHGDISVVSFSRDHKTKALQKARWKEGAHGLPEPHASLEPM